ncbi:MAG TPA: serine hydrolase domain-containing protein [Polyangia bacterium]|jgi:CubicO group peptidase (beta-lactamase class C family)|nr:serine hydrolase domain-containing protein [Polyangia bacterium]
MRIERILIVALSVLVPISRASATPPVTAPPPVAPGGGLTDPKEVEALLDEVIGQQMAIDHLPGAEVAVVKDGRLFFAKGYGYADVEQHLPVQADTTRFRAGSVSKLFAWTAVMQLVEQGRLDLHADVNRYLRQVRIPDTFDPPITLEHLLTHTAGFEERELGGVLQVQDAAALKPLDEALARALPARIYPPGEIVAYCNYCAALAGQIVAEVSGEPFEQYVARHILSPLHMDHSTFAQPPPVPARDRAVGYQIDQDGIPRVAKDHYIQLAPAGSLSTTATDMAHFMIAHLEGGRGGQGQILQAATLQDLHRQHYTFDPRLPGITWGFFEGQRNGVHTLWHGGNVDGFGSWLTLLPDQHVGIYVGFNGRGREHARLAVIHALIDRAYPAPAPPAVPPPADFAARAAGFTGSFRSTRRSERTVQKLASYLTPANRVVAHPDGTLSVEGPGAGLADRKGAPRRWVEIGPRLFQEVGGQATLAFRADAAGRIAALVVSTFPFIAYERLPWYDEGLVQLGGLALALLVLLGTGGVWLVGTLLRRARRRPDPRTALEQQTQRLAGAVIVTDLLLVVGVAIWLTAGDVTDHMPPLFYATAVLGVLSALGTGAMGIGAVQVWRRRAGHLGGRLHYTLLTLAALGVVAFLQHARLLGLHV